VVEPIVDVGEAYHVARDLVVAGDLVVWVTASNEQSVLQAIRISSLGP
jgi:hypothetical protein